MAEGYTFEDDDFRDGVIPPAATFEDTLVLFSGWHEHDADMHVAIMYETAAEVFRAHGGSTGQLPLSPPSYEEVLADVEARSVYLSDKCAELTAELTHKYLIGEGEDYENFAPSLQGE